MADAPAALVISHHVGKQSVLAELIEIWSRHPVLWAANGMALESGAIYINPPQRHVIINPDATLSVSSKPHIKFVRPSIDWLFESAAGSFRERRSL